MDGQRRIGREMEAEQWFVIGIANELVELRILFVFDFVATIVDATYYGSATGILVITGQVSTPFMLAM